MLSCNGAKTKQDALNQSIKKFKDSLDAVKFFPEKYSEVTIDTILSNGFRIKIKSYTDMDHVAEVKLNADGLDEKHYFREILSEIIVFKNEKQIFNQIIDDGFLPNINMNYILNEMYVDEERSLETNQVHLIANQCIPRSTNCSIFDIVVNENGDYKIEPLQRS